MTMGFNPRRSERMSVELEYEQYVTNLEGLVRARTEQLRAAVTKIEELRAELEALKQTKSSHQVG